jgi:hypothetical protein
LAALKQLLQFRSSGRTEEMIDQVDRNLEDWIGHIVEAAVVSLLAPGDAVEHRGIGLYLIEILQTPPPRGTRRPPLQITLRYLVTSWDKDPREAHRLLGDLLFAAMEHPDFEVEQDPLPIQIWMSLGVAPRPCFVLRVPLRLQRPEKPIPLVRQSLLVKTSTLRRLTGRVLGPQDTPIMNARVEVPSLLLSTQTDFGGRFALPGLPADPSTVVLRVKARGQTVTVQADVGVLNGEPLVIRFSELEV